MFCVSFICCVLHAGRQTFGHSHICSVFGVILHIWGGDPGNFLWSHIFQLDGSRGQQIGHRGVQKELASSN